MHPHTFGSEDLRARFLLEARIAAHVESDFIVDVFDAGVDEATSIPFLVMELLRGEELSKRLKRLGTLAPAEALVYLHQLALALDKTHRASIVHRDLKPENLFLTEREDGPPRIKVLDFGVAKLLLESSASSAATMSIGTPLYMSPEQFNPRLPLTAAADIYALGMIAFTLLTGRPYWAEEARGTSVFAFAAVALHGPRELATVRAAARQVTLPLAFDPWFARVAHADPLQRFETATAAVRDLAVGLGLPSPGWSAGVATAPPAAGGPRSVAPRPPPAPPRAHAAPPPLPALPPRRAPLPVDASPPIPEWPSAAFPTHLMPSPSSSSAGAAPEHVTAPATVLSQLPPRRPGARLGVAAGLAALLLGGFGAYLIFAPEQPGVAAASEPTAEAPTALPPAPSGAATASQPAPTDPTASAPEPTATDPTIAGAAPTAIVQTTASPRAAAPPAASPPAASPPAASPPAASPPAASPPAVSPPTASPPASSPPAAAPPPKKRKYTRD